jgi:trehalose 6-phosphate phosphatase
VFPAAGICLFLDFDGTLVDFAATPGDVRVEPGVVTVLRALEASLGGALAMVSGRPLADIDALLDPLRLPGAGLHGVERRDAAGHMHRPQLPAAALQAARTMLRDFVDARRELLLEDKGVALAVHYRRAPQAREVVQAMVAKLGASLFPEFEILEGDMVLEIKPARHDKASAVSQFMREAPFRGRVPVFVGDDVTDCDGFSAVRQHGGMTVAVGERVSAQWFLPDPRAIRGWLAQLAGVGLGHGP